MNKPTRFIILLIAVVFASCTESFKHKQQVAENFLDEMMAKSVAVSYSTETTNGQTMNMTTLKYEGCSDDLEDAERERRANNVAVAAYQSLSKEMKDETNMKIIAITEEGEAFEYLFNNNDLAAVDAYKKVADEMIEACLALDTAKIKSLKDESYMPDADMHTIYRVNQYNDSVYTDMRGSKEFIGFRLTEGAEDKNLKMYSANYEYSSARYVTYYTINVDRTTNKVVYLWVKTDPK